jgi:hypothetical protein
MKKYGGIEMAYLWGVTNADIQTFLGTSSESITLVTTPSAGNEFDEAEAEKLFNFAAINMIPFIGQGYIIDQTSTVPLVGTYSEIVLNQAKMEGAAHIGFIKEVVQFGKDVAPGWIGSYYERVEQQLTQILQNHVSLAPLVKKSLTREQKYHLSRERYKVAPIGGL